MSEDVRARIRDNLKNPAQEILEVLGLNMSDYIRMSLTALVQQQGIPFELSVQEIRKIRYKNIDKMNSLE